MNEPLGTKWGYMRVFVGTSGWMYDWNKGKTLDWFVENAGLNAVELNASFYRFPFPNQVKHWVEIGSELSWSIKVNRFITHNFKFSKKSYRTFGKFIDIFNPLSKKIKFFLFQLPAYMTPRMLDSIESFLDRFDVGDRFALEPRNIGWFNEEIYRRCKTLGITLVSVDAPFARKLVKTSKDVYLRMHGRGSWYSYKYSSRDLSSIANGIGMLKPRNAYVFFNNDNDMLHNARSMLKLLEKTKSKA